jgi:hypothetical protein
MLKVLSLAGVLALVLWAMVPAAEPSGDGHQGLIITAPRTNPLVPIPCAAKIDCDFLSYAGEVASYYFMASGNPELEFYDLYNMRFTADIPPGTGYNPYCSLITAWVAVYAPAFVGEPDLDVIVWDDFDGYPNNELARVTIPFQDLPTTFGYVGADLTPFNLTFWWGDEFHIGITTSSTTPDAAVNVICDDGTSGTGRHSFWAGQWAEYSPDFNFFLGADVCYVDMVPDSDNDGVGNDIDNCRHIYNPDQVDIDGDGIGEACDYMCGDANGDSVSNIADGVFLLNYVFKDGPAPEPEEAADANSDGTINVGDAVGIVNYIFREGPPPYCPPYVTMIDDFLSCKNFYKGLDSDSLPRDQDCVFWEYDGQSNLEIHHKNAAFNCCPMEEYAELADFSNGTLIVSEYEILENGGCFCLCLFDIDYTIARLRPGNYTIRILGMYLSGQEPLEFEVTLTETPSTGSHCVTRTRYPWMEL